MKSMKMLMIPYYYYYFFFHTLLVLDIFLLSLFPNTKGLRRRSGPSLLDVDVVIREGEKRKKRKPET